MGTTRRGFGLIGFLSLSMACSPPEQPHRNDSAAVREMLADINRAFSAAYIAGDAAGVAALYTEDGILIPPGRTVRGRGAIQRYFTAPPGRRQVDHRLTTEDLWIEGATATEIGTWFSVTEREGEPPDTASERYLLVWRRGTDGRWRMKVDMWHRP